METYFTEKAKPSLVSAGWPWPPPVRFHQTETRCRIDRPRLNHIHNLRLSGPVTLTPSPSITSTLRQKHTGTVCGAVVVVVVGGGVFIIRSKCYYSAAQCSLINPVCVSERETELDLYSDHPPEHRDIIPLFHTLVI